jgi:hypothetical protein
VIKPHSARVNKESHKISLTLKRVIKTLSATISRVNDYIQLILITLFIHIRLQLVSWLNHVSRLLVTTVYSLHLSSQIFSFWSTFHKYSNSLPSHAHN